MKKSDLVKMGNHYFLGEDVAKTLLPRIKEKITSILLKLFKKN